jgi:hypothetical protein
MKEMQMTNRNAIKELLNSKDTARMKNAMDAWNATLDSIVAANSDIPTRITLHDYGFYNMANKLKREGKIALYNQFTSTYELYMSAYYAWMEAATGVKMR